ncbi:MAG: hypothetical protein ABI456_16840 [Ktedonobacteraceae bacterium]
MKYRFVFGLFLLSFTLMLAACGGSNGSSGPQHVQITESDFKIASSVTTFSPGTMYHFTVTNNGQAVHEFMIMPMGMNMSGMSMDNMHKMALTMIDTIAPGETKTLDYTFASSTSGQNFEFACHLPGHYEAGMKLPIAVNK